MPEDQTQISAFIARETKDALDAYVSATGAKKGRVIEAALDAYLATVDEIPAEYITPSTIVLTNESFDQLVDWIEKPGEPTQALRDLMRQRRALPW
jgi:uncharacterized protein (DUF1778 family)